MSEMWKGMNKLQNKLKCKTTAMPQSIKIGNTLIKFPQSICNKIDEHFLTICEKLSANVKSVAEQGYKKFLGKRDMSSIVIQPIDEHKEVKILAGLRKNKSPDRTDILVTLIKKDSKFEATRYLSNFFKQNIKQL